MKTIIKSILSVFAIALFTTANYAQTGIGTSSPDGSAKLDITSNSKGLLVPRMTSAQRTNISIPATGLIVYQTDGTAGFYYNAGTTVSPNWVILLNGTSPLAASNITGTVPIAVGGTGTTNGSITGTGALTFTAGGTNQNVSLTPSGTGNTVLDGKVGIGNGTPDASAQLEVKSSSKGFLPPRVTLTGTSDVATIASPATGLFVYNLATAGTFPNNVVPGFYYYDGSKWKRVNSGEGNTPSWTSAGTVQSVGITATTSAPTAPTNTIRNQVLYKQLGPKTWEVMVVLEFSDVTGAAAGSGDYLFTLPNGLSFDTNIEAQQAYQFNVGANSWVTFMKALPGCNVNIYQTPSNAMYSNGGPVVWDATKYRIVIPLIGTGVYCLQSGFFQFTLATSYSWRFTFQSL